MVGTVMCIAVVGLQSYQYDANGSLLTGGGRALTWDSENRVASVAAYTAAAVLLLIGELGFLGLYLGTPDIGVSPTGLQADPIYAEWGSMLAVGLRRRGQGWWMLLEPAIALSLAILAFTLLGEGLRRRR